MSWESALLDSIETKDQLGRDRLAIPQTRVRDAFSARQICLKLLDNDRLRGRERAKVQGMIDGNQPYDPLKLKSMGQGWRTNLNFMEAHANIQSLKTPYYAMIGSVPTFAEIRTKEGGENRELFSRIITAEFTKLIRRWPDFSFQMQKAQQELIKFGIGPVLMPDMYDWRFQALRHRDLLVPEKATAYTTNWPYFAIRTEMQAMDLWYRAMPDNAEYSEKVGWDIEMSREAVMLASKDIFGGRLTWDGRNWEQWQEVWKNNDLYMSLIASESLMVYHFFVREYSNKISHYILAENALIPDFLFKKVDRYDSINQILTIFRSDVGNGDYHSIRGIGRLQYQHLECTNRLKNHLFDMGIAGTAINLKAATSKARDEMQLMQLGPINVLPPDVDLVQNRVVGFLTDAITLDRELSNHLSANLGTFRRGVGYGGVGQTQRPNIMQIQQDIITSTQITEGQIILHFLDLDQLYEQMYRRASDPNSPDPEAKRFQKACRDREVPTIALRNYEYCRATRTGGYGSPQVRQMRSQQMMPYLGFLPEQGRYNWVRDEVIAIAGPENIERYFPPQRFPSEPQWEANMEDGVMHAGQAVMVADGQNHAVHLDVHITSVEDMVQMANNLYANVPAESGIAAMIKTQQYTQIITPHIQTHLQMLSSDPIHAREFKMLQTRFGDLTNVFRQIDAVVQQGQEHMQRVQGAQQSARTEDQIKIQQATTEMQIERALAAAKIRNQRDKTMSQIQSAQAKAGARPMAPRQQMMQEAVQAQNLISPEQGPAMPAGPMAAPALMAPAGGGEENELPLD
jgi:hypothetical protein